MIEVGDHAEFVVQITDEVHDAFANLSGDRCSLHTMGKLGYGFLLASYLSRLYGELLPKEHSICLRQEIDFVKRYTVGDVVKIVGIVVDVNESTRLVQIRNEFFVGDVLIARGKGLVQLV